MTAAPTPTPRYLTRPEAASYSAISLRTLDALVAEGSLPVARIGSRVVVDRDDLDAFLAGRKVRAAAT
ncbi:MAG: helix-turn-helix domain-containing protein [Lacipirellulaceae bacterium]